MAESYHLYPNEPWKSKGVHYFSVGNYSIFYVADNNVATVIHVSYGRRDLDKVFIGFENHVRRYSFQQYLVAFIFFVYYTFHRGRLVNCGGLPLISHE